MVTTTGYFSCPLPKGEIAFACSQSAPCRLYISPLFHFPQESIHHTQMSIEPSSIVQGMRETMENTVFYMFSLLASHTFLRINFKQNGNNL